MRALHTFILCIGLMILGCNKSRELGAGCGPQQCDANTACTAIIQHLFVDIADEEGAGVPLDYISVTRIKGNKTVIQRSIEARYQTGSYPLFSDNEKKETSWCGEDFEFKGYNNSRLMAKRIFKIGFDCCHVKVLEGDTKIVVRE